MRRTANAKPGGSNVEKEPTWSEHIIYGLHRADGIAGACGLDDRSVDLLLADPPRSGRGVPDTEEWTDAILPKVRGWCVIFCDQRQIGQHNDILKRHGFNAVGPIVWHQTDQMSGGRNGYWTCGRRRSSARGRGRNSTASLSITCLSSGRFHRLNAYTLTRSRSS